MNRKLIYTTGLFSLVLSSCNFLDVFNKTKSEHSFIFVNEVSATCASEGVKEHYICDHCDKYFNENKNEISYETLLIAKNENHVFNQEVEKLEYLANSANCSQEAVYYKSCICGLSSENNSYTFTREHGPHDLEHHDPEILNDKNYDIGEYYSCNICTKLFSDADGIKEIKNPPAISKKINLLNKKNGAVIDNLDSTVKTFLNTVNNPETLNDEVADFLYHDGCVNGGKTISNSVDIYFECNNSIKMPLKIEISSDENFTNVEQTYTLTARTSPYKLNNPLPGTHYYRIYDSSDIPNYSGADSFTIENKLRTIYTKNTVQNMRDFGGWESSLGNIKYGLIYRSANWDSVNLDCEKIFKDELGIKTELDIRFDSSSNNYSASAHPMEGVNFRRLGLTDYYPNMFTHADTIASLRNIFTGFLLNKSNYPFDFHCTSGADRTGLLALLIGGALGFTNDSLFKDYELTSFYKSRRIRCDILVGNDNGTDYYYFDPSGKCDQCTTPTAGSFKANTDYLLANYGDGSGNISNAVCGYLKEVIGVGSSDFKKLRTIMIENYSE